MKLWLARRGRALIPTDQSSEAAVMKMEDGECAVFEIVRPRSVNWHRMYFAICASIGRNQDPPRDEDSIDHELRVLAGHYDTLFVGEHEVRVPKRIAFHKLSGDQWSELWPAMEQAICEHYGEEYLGESRKTGTW